MLLGSESKKSGFVYAVACLALLRAVTDLAVLGN
jgi:hypothetical protein